MESEPEVQAVRAFLSDPDRNVKVAGCMFSFISLTPPFPLRTLHSNNVSVKSVDLHSFGPSVLHPWIHSENRSCVPRYDELQTLAWTMAKAINDVHGAQYKPEMVQRDIFYLCSR